MMRVELGYIVILGRKNEWECTVVKHVCEQWRSRQEGDCWKERRQKVSKVEKDSLIIIHTVQYTNGLDG